MIRPKIVVTLHGIRTAGTWQKLITPHLARHGLIPYHIDYGILDSIDFLNPFKRERIIDKIRLELLELQTKEEGSSINLICHSFGSYIATEVIQRERGNFLVDRLVLTGSIVGVNWNWTEMFNNRWIEVIRNERATSDWAVSCAEACSRPPLSWFTRLTAGKSGLIAFLDESPCLIDGHVNGNHSQVLNPQKFQQWAKFISYPNLFGSTLESVKTELNRFRQVAAGLIKVELHSIRANLFAPLSRDRVGIVPNAFDNMTYEPELHVDFGKNEGCTGTAFFSAEPEACYDFRGEQGWKRHFVATSRAAMAHPDLQWVVSLPIVSSRFGRKLGVVSIDGLKESDVFHEKDSLDANGIVTALQLEVDGSEISAILERAYSGETL